jgi:hypothetical protein
MRHKRESRFKKSLDNDQAEKALKLIQKLYAVVRIARDRQLDTASIKELRLK